MDTAVILLALLAAGVWLAALPPSGTFSTLRASIMAGSVLTLTTSLIWLLLRLS